MKAVVATKNKIRRRKLKSLLDEAYPNSTVCSFDDVMLAAKHIMEYPTDVLFADSEAIRLIQMLKKSRDGVIIIILAENDFRKAEAIDMGIKALLIDPITHEKMIDAIEGAYI